MMRNQRWLGGAVAVLFLVAASPLIAADLTIVSSVPVQAFSAQAKRVSQALEFVGSPLTKEQAATLDKAFDDKDAPVAIQKVLDPLCLIEVNINPESRVKVARGPAAAQLVENGWRQFLIKVVNEAGVTAALRASSPNALSLHGSPSATVINRWLGLATFDKQPLLPTLSGGSLG